MKHIITWTFCLFLVAACTTTTEKPDKKPIDETGGPKTTVAKVKPPDISVEGKEAFADAISSYRAQKKSGRFDYEALLASFESAIDKDTKNIDK